MFIRFTHQSTIFYSGDTVGSYSIKVSVEYMFGMEDFIHI